MSVSPIHDFFRTCCQDKRVLVSVGSGGVGKTSSAAALALMSAVSGWANTLVMTIDPARRLANAFGLNAFGNSITPIDAALLKQVAPHTAPKALYATMLDVSQAFDEMVSRYAPQDQIENLKSNRLYQLLLHRLAGLQEYMAVSQLYDVVQDARYERIIIDTPPTAHALDFLDAPSRFIRFFEHDTLRWLMESKARKLSFRLLDVGASLFSNTIGKLSGVEILSEIAEFIATFEPVLKGFQSRAQNIETLLKSRDLGFLIVTAPTHQQIDEALFFYQTLRTIGPKPCAIIVNRTHPPLPQSALSQEALIELTRARASHSDSAAIAKRALAWGADYQAAAALEVREIERLKSQIDSRIPVLTIREQPQDVHNLASLHALGLTVIQAFGAL